MHLPAGQLRWGERLMVAETLVCVLILGRITDLIFNAQVPKI